MVLLIASFVLGLAGSLHCVAMCGPLVAVMANVFGRGGPVVLWYQAGRIGSYVAIGGAAGLAGAGIGALGFGRVLAVGAGLIMLLTAFGLVVRMPRLLSAWWTARIARVLHGARGVRAGHPVVSATLAGAVNGALPCGLVYAAAVLATTAGSAWAGATVMLLFALGTTPLLLTIWLTAGAVPAPVRHRMRMMIPAAIALTGLLLVGRGFIGSVPHSGSHGPGTMAAAPAAHVHE